MWKINELKCRINEPVYVKENEDLSMCGINEPVYVED